VNSSEIKPKDWISIGSKPAVVCKVYPGTLNKVEVVYLDRDRAINEDALFENGRWVFNQHPSGGYADNNPNLGEYVRILRAGRWWESK